MKYTIFTQFTACFYYPWDVARVLDEVIELTQGGHVIYLVYCDGKCINTCFRNMTSKKNICRCCMQYKRMLFRRLPKSVHLISFSDYKSVLTKSSDVFEYSNTSEIKKIEYKGVKIGYAALSTYLTMSRNLFPKIDDEFRRYFDKSLFTCCQYTDLVEAIIRETQPDIIGCYNSRFLDARPVVDLAKKMSIPHVCYESTRNTKNEHVKVSFRNTPHDVEENTQRINDYWNTSPKTNEEKELIARDFYCKRKHSIVSGDKLYVKDQKLGMLPREWDANKHNVLILNSSEDEFASLGEEFENRSLFSSQFEGIQYMITAYQHQTDFHFYLRVHPNLRSVKYQYHLSLYSLFDGLSNFTIIPPDSPVSTYSLIDHCDKVIVFGSTTGPEAVFWGKPTILLNYCLYSQLNICYTPMSKQELDSIILDRELRPKSIDGALKYGYYRLNDDNPPLEHFVCTDRTIHFFNRQFEVSVYQWNFFSRFIVILVQILGKYLYYKNYSCPTEEASIEA